GSVLPLHGSSTGLVFAAYKTGLEEGADVAVLERIRRDGLHAIHGLLMPGVNALSVPLFKTGRELAGVITVVGSQASFAAEAHGEAAQTLLAMAREVSLRMGGEV
ncbi:hypothetical protein AADU03_005401, partial [Escherichia coli]